MELMKRVKDVMIKLRMNKRALSQVVTTLIILVVAVLLAGVVVYYAVNIVSTSVQEESLNLVYQHVWFSTTDQKAEAAMMITNTGGRDVVFQNIAVRGQPVPTADIYYFKPTTLADLPYVSNNATVPLTNTTAVPTGFGATGDFLSVTGPLTLASGKTIAVYIAGTATFSPGSVTVNDVGLTIAISVFTAQATYIKETNVNAA